MSIRFFYTSLRRFRWGTKTTTSPIAARFVSSHSSSSDASDRLSTRSSGVKNGWSEIMRMSGSWSNVPALLQERIDSGHVVTVSELRFICKRLLKSERYDDALEMMEWMEARNDVKISAYDHVVRLELIIKVHGLKEAGEYFARIQSTTSLKAVKAACLPLLRGYVKKRLVDEAEALMKKLNYLGVLISPHPFDEMMKLYEATNQFEKVSLVIMQMKRNNIPRIVLSYNLWMNACGEASGVASVETVYREMVSDKSVEVGWSTLCTLANVYIKAGLDEKAILVLKNAEKKLNTSNRLGYFFLITLYASLRNKEGVLRLWEASKSIGGRISCANYICILSSLVKLGDLVQAESVFKEWEARCLKYDVRVSNVLLGAYARNGLMDKAESLHTHALKRGGKPNYKTFEILIEGWVKHQNMAKAIDAMNKAFGLMKHCHWRPSQNIIMVIAEYFEKHEKFEEANEYVRHIHQLGLASLPLYRLLLRMHAEAKRPDLDILEMMKMLKIRAENETHPTSAGLQSVN